MKLVAAILCAAVIGGAVAVFATLNFGAEVVTLYTKDAQGREYPTPLWILEQGETLWLRAERPTSPWLARLRAQPQVELERRGRRASYRAVLSPEARRRINQRMAERYGWAERIMALIQDRESAVPIRLAPLEEP